MDLYPKPVLEVSRMLGFDSADFSPDVGRSTALARLSLGDASRSVECEEGSGLILKEVRVHVVAARIDCFMSSMVQLPNRTQIRWTRHKSSLMESLHT